MMMEKRYIGQYGDYTESRKGWRELALMQGRRRVAYTDDRWVVKDSDYLPQDEEAVKQWADDYGLELD